MKSAATQFTVTLRRVASGFGEVTFQTDDLTHAHTIAGVLLASPAYNHCYAVATDWKNQVVFNLSPAYRAPVVPQQVSQYAPPPYPQPYASVPARTPVAPPLARHQTPPYGIPVPPVLPTYHATAAPALPAYRAPAQSGVVDAEFEEIVPNTSRLRALPR